MIKIPVVEEFERYYLSVIDSNANLKKKNTRWFEYEDIRVSVAYNNFKAGFHEGGMFVIGRRYGISKKDLL